MLLRKIILNFVNKLRMSPFLSFPFCKAVFHFCFVGIISILFYFPYQVHGAQDVQLTWHPNTENDLAGYFIYSGTTSGVYGSPVNTGLNTSHTFSGLLEGLTHFFTVTAFDTSGNESLPSIEVTKFIPSVGNGSTTLLVANFDSNTDTFSYSDDTFQSTNQPTYAKGAYLPSGGFSGGALQVELGGLNNNTILGMSGGWRTSFHLAAPSDVVLSFYYKLSQAADYESDEFSETLVTVDSLQLGVNGNEYIAHLAGNGNGGGTQTTNWQFFQATLPALSAGTHVLTLGGYNNKKTYANESTEILIDQVLVEHPNVPASDTTPPSTPGNLSATPESSTHIALDWDASSDEVGVKEYEVLRNNVLIATTTTTQYADTVLAPSTSYAYSVIAYDEAGNDSQPAQATATTPSTPDTIPPSVTLTAPANGSTVSGSVLLTAQATDNVGVVGVQFQINGGNHGSEDSSPSYSIPWDTTSLAAGTYTLTAIARDGSGNATTSAPVSVTKLPAQSGNLEITNLTDHNTSQPYQVIEDGLADGVFVFLDSTRTFTEVPPHLQGATFIRTAKGDRKETSPNPFVSFSVNQPVTVYIGIDKKITPPPSWLNAYSKTGDSLSTTSHDILEIYEQTFSSGTIDLGANHGTSNTVMYTIIIVPQ